MDKKPFTTSSDCLRHLETIFWNNGPICPYCTSRKHTRIANRVHCNSCNTPYSITTQTIFHNTKIEMAKWFSAIPEIINNQISIRALSTLIAVNKNTANKMINKVRLADKANQSFFETLARSISEITKKQ